MADQPGKRRGRPRKVVSDAELPASSEGASPSVDGGRQDYPETHFDGPRDWAEAVALLSRVEGIVTRITVPFEAPALHETPHYGAPVVRGSEFAIYMADGTRKG